MCGHVNTENQLGSLESKRRHHRLELKLLLLLIYPTGVMCREGDCAALEEQAVLLTTEPSLQPVFVLIFFFNMH